MKSAFSSLLLLSTLSFTGCAEPMTGESDSDVNYDKVIYPTRDQAADPAKARTVNITYHSGAVMTGGVNVYYIWYGSWTNNTATTILTDMAGAVGGTSYWGINTSYYSQTSSGGAKTYIPNSVTYKGSTTVAYPYGTNLSDTQILQVVKDYIGTGAPDANGIYFVLTSSDVTASSGFCTQYCGWHSYATINGVSTKYSFIGNPDRCITSCAMYSSNTPNANAGADGMASILIHEAEEAATDPELKAWYDSRGYENADKCAWTYGATSKTAGGAVYNVTWGTRNYLIQQNWSASTQACGLK